MLILKDLSGSGGVTRPSVQKYTDPRCFALIKLVSFLATHILYNKKIRCKLIGKNCRSEA